MIFDWLFKKKADDTPEFWKRYLERVGEPFSRKLPIEEVPFVVLDTETTGLDVKSDQILSIGAVEVRGAQIRISRRFECLVHQEYQPVGDAITIHGIIPRNRNESLKEGEALMLLLDFIGNSVIVGHHIGFDIAMVNCGLKQIGGRKLQNLMVDTAGLAARLMPSQDNLIPGSLSLDKLCAKYNIPIHGRHTAGGDAFMTAILFLKLVARLRVRGVKTLGDLLRKF